jgi:putative nucleotidyltransferase with HDIG domain
MRSEIAFNGKEALLFLLKGNFDCLLIDIQTKNHSAFDVIKSAKHKLPALKVILTFPSKEQEREWADYKDQFLKIGVSDMLTWPYSLEKLTNSLAGEIQHEAWRNVELTEIKKEEKAIIRDSEVTKIPLKDFFTGSIVVFDVFIRLGKNNYVKVLHQGNRFDPAILRKYANKMVQFLYFRTNDRKGYINQVNSFLESIVNKNSISSMKKVKLMKGVAQQYIDEIHLKGVTEEMVEEGNKIIDNVYHFLSRDSGIGGLLREFEEINPEVYSHQFLVMFFSILVCKNLSWVSDSTMKIVAQGAILHDIGKLKFPPELHSLQYDQMNQKQKDLYEQHPRLGLELLDRFAIIPESVKQIVYQHHELVTGEGFPLKLSGIKIYPLAKVIGFMDYYANQMARNKVTPINALKEIMGDRRVMHHYDSAVIKGLIQGFRKR